MDTPCFSSGFSRNTSWVDALRLVPYPLMMRKGRAGGNGPSGFCHEKGRPVLSGRLWTWVCHRVWAVPPWEWCVELDDLGDCSLAEIGRNWQKLAGISNLSKDGQTIEYEWKLFCIVELACTTGKVFLRTGVLRSISCCQCTEYKSPVSDL